MFLGWATQKKHSVIVVSWAQFMAQILMKKGLVKTLRCYKKNIQRNRCEWNKNKEANGDFTKLESSLKEKIEKCHNNPLDFCSLRQPIPPLQGK